MRTMRQPMNAIARTTNTNTRNCRHPPWAALPQPGSGLALTHVDRSLSGGRKGLSVTGGVGDGVPATLAIGAAPAANGAARPPATDKVSAASTARAQLRT